MATLIPNDSLAGLGVEGDAHMGVTVKHRLRINFDRARMQVEMVQNDPKLAEYS
ncbi:MAG: hypothetical protein N4J56_001410 [Chroococcidiopsis sp. SAG 2025]|nr:hypothetical protein [Chroococcidiopsis sp. SAG 2025]